MCSLCTSQTKLLETLLECTISVMKLLPPSGLTHYPYDCRDVWITFVNWVREQCNAMLIVQHVSVCEFIRLYINVRNYWQQK